MLSVNKSFYFLYCHSTVIRILFGFPLRSCTIEQRLIFCKYVLFNKLDQHILGVFFFSADCTQIVVVTELLDVCKSQAKVLRLFNPNFSANSVTR